jgi:hypothetical protein
MAPVNRTGSTACRADGAARQAIPKAHVVTVLCVFLLNIHDAFCRNGRVPAAANWPA